MILCVNLNIFIPTDETRLEHPQNNSVNSTANTFTEANTLLANNSPISDNYVDTPQSNVVNEESNLACNMLSKESSDDKGEALTNFKELLTVMKSSDVECLYDCIDSIAPLTKKESIIACLKQLVKNNSVEQHSDVTVDASAAPVVDALPVSTPSKVATFDEKTELGKSSEKSIRAESVTRSLKRSRSHSRDEGLVDPEYMSHLCLIDYVKPTFLAVLKKKCIKVGGKRQFYGQRPINVGLNNPYTPRLVLLDVKEGETAPVDPRGQKRLKSNQHGSKVNTKKLKIRRLKEHNRKLLEQINNRKAASEVQESTAADVPSDYLNLPIIPLQEIISPGKYAEKDEKAMLLEQLNSELNSESVEFSLPKTPQFSDESQESLDTLYMRTEALKSALHQYDQHDSDVDIPYGCDGMKKVKLEPDLLYNEDSNTSIILENDVNTVLDPIADASALYEEKYRVKDMVPDSYGAMHDGGDIEEKPQRSMTIDPYDTSVPQSRIKDWNYGDYSSASDFRSRECGVYSQRRKRGRTDTLIPHHYGDNGPTAPKCQKQYSSANTAYDDSTLLHAILDTVDRSKISSNDSSSRHGKDRVSNSSSRSSSINRYVTQSETSSRSARAMNQGRHLGRWSPPKCSPVRSRDLHSPRRWPSDKAHHRGTHRSRSLKIDYRFDYSKQRGTSSRRLMSPARGPRTPPGLPRSPFRGPRTPPRERDEHLSYGRHRDHVTLDEGSPIYIY